MTNKERIQALEQRILELELRLAQLSQPVIPPVYPYRPGWEPWNPIPQWPTYSPNSPPVYRERFWYSNSGNFACSSDGMEKLDLLEQGTAG